MSSADAPARRPRGTLRLTRSPFELAVLARLGGAALVLLATGYLLGSPLAEAPAPAFDAALARRFTAPPGTAQAWTALLLGRVGHLIAVTAVAAVIALVARRRSGHWDVALLLTTVLGGATAITGALKLLVDRARPDGAVALTAAYPSGHTVRAVAVFGLVAWVLRYWTRRPTVRVLVVPIALALVAVNGAARVVLGVHWPTDVLVGLFLGGAWLGVSFRVLRPSPA